MDEETVGGKETLAVEKTHLEPNRIRKGERFQIVLTTAITTWFFNELSLYH